MVLPSDDFGQVNWVLGGDSLPTGGQHTCGVRFDGPATPGVAMADALADAWANSIAPLINSGVTLIETRLKVGPDDTGPVFVGAMGSFGTAGGSSSPPNVSLLIRKVTAGGGRANRGRMYVPGISEDDTAVDGVLTPTFLSTAAGLMDDLLADMTAAGATPVVLHGAGSPVTIPTTITSFVMDNRVATQRRRLRR